MSEIKQMYLNAYYGKTFVEKAVPTQDENDFITEDKNDFKKLYKKDKRIVK